MDIKRYTKHAESNIYDPFDGEITNALTPDEAEVLRLYQMQDLEGRTEILHTAYEQKRRLADKEVIAEN